MLPHDAVSCHLPKHDGIGGQAALYCVDPQGTLRWQFNVSENAFSPLVSPYPTKRNGTIFVSWTFQTTHDTFINFIAALDPPTGKVRWQKELPASGSSSPKRDARPERLRERRH